jgi:hypothetical protein
MIAYGLARQAMQYSFLPSYPIKEFLKQLENESNDFNLAALLRRINARSCLPCYRSLR